MHPKLEERIHHIEASLFFEREVADYEYESAKRQKMDQAALMDLLLSAEQARDRHEQYAHWQSKILP